MHPFFTDRPVGRLPGEPATYDVFVSYRVDSDAALVEKIHQRLTAQGLRVQSGETWLMFIACRVLSSGLNVAC